MAESKVTITCVNPYYKGKKHGVQFRQARGGAVGYATSKQAEKFAGEKAFRVEGAAEAEVEGAETVSGKLTLVTTTVETTSALTQVKGIGPATAAKLEALGIDTLGNLAIADTAELATDLGEKPEVVEAWQAAAKEIIAG